MVPRFRRGAVFLFYKYNLSKEGSGSFVLLRFALQSFAGCDLPPAVDAMAAANGYKSKMRQAAAFDCCIMFHKFAGCIVAGIRPPG